MSTVQLHQQTLKTLRCFVYDYVYTGMYTCIYLQILCIPEKQRRETLHAT